jgi:hypothetical protein
MEASLWRYGTFLHPVGTPPNTYSDDKSGNTL